MELADCQLISTFQLTLSSPMAFPCFSLRIDSVTSSLVIGQVKPIMSGKCFSLLRTHFSISDSPSLFPKWNIALKCWRQWSFVILLPTFCFLPDPIHAFFQELFWVISTVGEWLGFLPLERLSFLTQQLSVSTSWFNLHLPVFCKSRSFVPT